MEKLTIWATHGNSHSSTTPSTSGSHIKGLSAPRPLKLQIYINRCVMYRLYTFFHYLTISLLCHLLHHIAPCLASPFAPSSCLPLRRITLSASPLLHPFPSTHCLLHHVAPMASVGNAPTSASAVSPPMPSGSSGTPSMPFQLLLGTGTYLVPVSTFY